MSARTRRWRAAAASVLLSCVLLAGVIARAVPTSAAWADAENGSGSFAAGSVTPVTSMGCTAGVLQPVTFTWAAPAGGITRTGYRWTVTGALSGSGTLPATATSVQLTTGLLGIGSGTFSLYAVGTGGWESPVKTGSLSFVTVVLDVVSTCSVP